MATQNPFALLEEDETDDPAVLIARVGAANAQKEVKKPPSSQQPTAPAKLPTKPPPPAQAVRESRGEGGRGRVGRGGGRGNFGNRDRGSEGGYNRPNRENGPQGERGDYNDRNYRNGGGEYRGNRGGYAGGNAMQNGEFSVPRDDGDGRFSQEGGRGRGRGRGRGYFADGDEQGGRRAYDRRSGSGRGNEIKREGSGRGNWGSELDQIAPEEVEVPVTEEKATDVVEKKSEEGAEVESGEKKEAEEEEKEMTLEEYEKVKAEKRKVLDGMKAEVRKVAVDAEFASMQLVDKKVDEDFLKLGADKGKKKELLDKEERARKSVSINEFLRPAEGESTYGRRGRGGRGRGGDRGGFRGGFGGPYNSRETVTAPRIEDQSQFPTLGGK